MYSRMLKSIRKEKKLFQKDIAKILGIAEITYTHYESEYYIMPIKYLDIISNYFKISLDYIFEFSCANNDDIGCLDKKVHCIRLKEFRKENNLTQLKLASILNTTQSAIAEYERGTNVIATPFLYTICKKYKISADYLLGKTDRLKYFEVK